MSRKMENDLTLIEYKNLLDDISFLYKKYKENPVDDTLYNSIRSNLKKIDELVRSGKIPRDLIYKTDKYIIGMYRLLESKRLKKSK